MMKMNPDKNPYSLDFWYDLTDGGYLDPDELCADKADAERVKAAVHVLQEYMASIEEAYPNFLLRE